MLRNETKLTKYTLAGLSILLVFFFCAGSANADDDVDVSAICAATGALVATKTEGFAGDLIMMDARWWKSFLQELLEGNEEATLQTIETTAKAIQVAHNDGTLDWQRLVDVSQQCSLTKVELIDVAAER